MTFNQYLIQIIIHQEHHLPGDKRESRSVPGEFDRRRRELNLPGSKVGSGNQWHRALSLRIFWLFRICEAILDLREAALNWCRRMWATEERLLLVLLWAMVVVAGGEEVWLRVMVALDGRCVDMRLRELRRMEERILQERWAAYKLYASNCSHTYNSQRGINGEQRLLASM
jgi:hypothetical protein